MSRFDLNKQEWVQTDCGIKCTTDELFERLMKTECRIVVLDGYSGCGKTMLLRRIRDALAGKVHIFSDERFVDILIKGINGDSSLKKRLMELLLGQGNIICIEDVDLYGGKIATQEEVAYCAKIGAQGNLVILTGNDMYKRVPHLLKILGGEVWHTDRK